MTGRAPRVLLYTDSARVYGVEQCTHALALALRSDGCDVTCAQAPATHVLVEERTRVGIAHRWIEPDDLWLPAEQIRALRCHDEARAVLSEVEPDLVVFGDSNPVSSLAAKEVAAAMDIPFVCVVHLAGLPPQFALAPVFERLRAVHRVAAAVVTVSGDTLARLRSEFGLGPDAGVVIHNGRPPRFFAEPDGERRAATRRALFGSEPSDDVERLVVFVTVGRLDHGKGHGLQLRAFEKLRSHAAWDRMRFVWVGDGSLGPRLRALVRLGGLSRHVLLLGVRGDVDELLRAADAFVLPSYEEAFPLAVIEAMAAGLPVVATAVNGVPEAVGPAAVLLPDPNRDEAGTVAGLVDAIGQLALDPTRRRTLGRAAHERAAARFDEETMLAKYRRVLTPLLRACGEKEGRGR